LKLNWKRTDDEKEEGKEENEGERGWDLREEASNVDGVRRGELEVR